MDVTAIQAVLGTLPGGGVAALAIWFAIRKDNQCNAQMDRMTELVEKSIASTVEVRVALDSIRDAIRAGTRT